MRESVKIVLAVAASALLQWSCQGTRVIPDDKLKQITKEVFLSNAYAGSHRNLRMDSLDIYTPIFRKYGYTVNDFSYTLSSFAKRKSSRLSDIIRDAYNELDKEYAYYKRRLAILDTVSILVDERFKKQVLYDSLIRAKTIQDTTRLKVTIPLEEGTYKISYCYKIDSLDVNNGQRASFFTIDSAGRRTVASTQWMSRNERQRRDVSISATSSTKKMLINFGTYQKTAVSPLDLTIDSLVIVRYLPRQVALDSIDKVLVDYKLLIDGKEYDRLAKDSLAVAVRPPWVAEEHGGKRR